MARIHRRKFLKLSGAGAIAASASGGLAAILASGRAPAYAQAATSVHWLRWADFVPASDKLLKEKIVPECQKALGIKLNVEMINANDLQARTTAAIQSGTGPDIIMLIGTWPQLYADSVVDVSDVAEEIGKAQGGYYDTQRNIATVGGKWIGVPWAVGGGLVTYRKSWLAASRRREIPGNLGRIPGDRQEAEGGWSSLWSDGRTHLRRRTGMVVSLSVVVGRQGGRGRRQDRRAEQQGDDRVGQIRCAVVERDDGRRRARLGRFSSNNRAFLSGSISATNNGASIYLEAKKKPDSYLTESGKPMKDDILHTRIPKGPGGQFNARLAGSPTC